MNETPKGKRTDKPGKWTLHLTGGTTLTVEFDATVSHVDPSDGLDFERAGRTVATVYFGHVAAIVRHELAQ